MGYKKTITDIGLKWLANSVAGSKVVFDNIVFSDTKSDKDLNSITINDFVNPMAVGVNKLIEDDKGFTAMSVTSNKNGEHHKAIVVGVVGHTDNEPDQKLIAVAVSDDDVPIFSMEPNQVGNYNISFSVQYSNSANVELNANNIPIANMDDVKAAVNIYADDYDFGSKLDSYATKNSVSAISNSLTDFNASLSSVADKAKEGINPASLNSMNSAISSLTTTQQTISNYINSTDAHIDFQAGVYNGPFFILGNIATPPNDQSNTLKTPYFTNNNIYISELDISKDQRVVIQFDKSSNNPHVSTGNYIYQNDKGFSNIPDSVTFNTSQLRNGGSVLWLPSMSKATLTAPTNKTLRFLGADGSASTKTSTSGSYYYYAIISSITIS